MSIRLKIFLAFAFLFLFALAVVIRIGEKELLPRYNEAVEDTLSDFSHIIADVVAQNAWDEKTKDLDAKKIKQIFFRPPSKLQVQIHNKQKELIESHIYVTDKNGKVLFDSLQPQATGQDYSRWNDVLKTLRGEYGARATRLIPNDPLSTTLYSAAPIKIDGSIVGVVSAGKPVRGFSHFLVLAQSRMYVAAGIVALVGLLVSLFVAYRISRPIEELRKYLLSLTTPRPLPVPKIENDELGALTTSFVEMKSKLEAKEYVETYMTQLTHEIKSPISAILGAAEILKDSKQNNFSDQLMNNIYLEGKRLQAIAEKLLEIASLEKREQPLQNENFDLELLFNEIIDSFHLPLQKKNIQIKSLQLENVSIRGERFLLWRSFSNLIQNAIEFSPQDGTIHIAAKNISESIQITITDEGPGIPKFAEQKVFEKFFSLERPDTGRKGTGLGLVFAKTVFEKHSGTINIKNIHPHGCEVTVLVPAKQTHV